MVGWQQGRWAEWTYEGGANEVVPDGIFTR